MDKRVEILNSFAGIFSYPEENYKSFLIDFYSNEPEAQPDLGGAERRTQNIFAKNEYNGGSKSNITRSKSFLPEDFNQFYNYAVKSSISELQEQYAATFDLNPSSTLNLSYHIFKEDLRRGPFLSLLKEEEIKNGITCDSELPDYLPVILELLSKNSDADLSKSLINRIVHPALLKLKELLDNNKNIYAHPVNALIKYLSSQLEVNKDV